MLKSWKSMEKRLVENRKAFAKALWKKNVTFGRTKIKKNAITGVKNCIYIY